jgi:putative flippase GtrA
LIHHFASKQFLAFLLTGGLAAIANFSSRIFYSKYCDFSTAIIFAYITGMICAFILAKFFVFTRGQQALHKSILLFTLVNLAGILQTWVVSMGLDLFVLPTLGVQNYKQDIAHAIGISVPVFTSFLGHKFYSFK